MQFAVWGLVIMFCSFVGLLGTYGAGYKNTFPFFLATTILGGIVGLAGLLLPPTP